MFHPDLKKHPTDNEQTIKLNEFFRKRYDVKSLEWFLRNLRDDQVKTLYLNWYENPVKNNHPFVQLPIYAIKYWVLKYCKWKGIKIVYAFHNQLPHGVERGTLLYEKIAKPFLRKALRISDVVVIHSKYTKEYIKQEFDFDDMKKVTYIPIGKDQKYITETPKYHLRERLGIADDELVFGYIGRLTKYKQIDKAILAFQRAGVKAKLVIIGKADSDYAEELNSLITSKDVIIEYRYVDDDEMNNSISELDAMILPYDNTCLNSGPMLQSFLNGTTMIGTNIGTARDFPANLMYAYDYDSEEDHINKITQNIIRAHNDFQSGTLKQMGQELQKRIILDNNWEVIEEQVMTII